MTLVNQLLLLCLFCCLLPTPMVQAASPPLPDENIHIHADNMSQQAADGIYIAEGNVVAHWKGQRLVADRVTYSSLTHVLHATGSVVLSKESIILNGETLVMNTDTGRAEMDSTLLTTSDSGIHLTADKLVRINEREYIATSSELTTCDLPDPSWKFGTDTMNADLQGYATGRNVIFYIKDIPVLYLPWLAFPATLEKRSGFLFPHLAYSKDKGGQLGIPLYLVISPSQDIQIDLDIMTRRGIGTGAEYRYIRTRGSEGRLDGYQIYDQVENRWRWQIALQHKEIFSSDANLRMSVNSTSDRQFLHDLGDKSGEYNRQSNDTIINALKTWQQFAFNSYLRYSEDLYAPNNQATLQTMPSFGIAAVRQQLLSIPLYFDLDAAAENLYRENAPTGQRLRFFPRLTLLPYQNGYIQASLFGGLHIRQYSTDRQGTDSVVQSRSGDLLPEAGIRLSTSLTRIYDTNFQLLKKMRHEIIPEVSYGYTPQREQQKLPFYDYNDRIIHENVISLAVTSMLNGKFMSGDTHEYRDISRIRLEARYSISGEQRDLQYQEPEQHPWSNLILESETWLAKQLRVTFDSRYDAYADNLAQAMAGIEFDDKEGTVVGAGYQMARSGPEVEYLEGRLVAKLFRPLKLSYSARYSFDKRDFLETLYAVEYRHKCWNITLGMHHHPGSQSFSVNFNLAGLGDTPAKN